MKTVCEALDILDTLTYSYKKLNLKTISEKTGINKSSAFKILQDLCNYGYVQKLDNGSNYKLGTNILNSLSHLAQRNCAKEIVHPYLVKLNQATNHVVNMMMLFGYNGVYVDIVPQSEKNSVGSVDHMHATALGKAIMAYLPSEQVDAIIAHNGLKDICPNTICDMDSLRNDLNLTKQRGFAIDDEENHLGSRCVAAPLITSAGEVIGAISISSVSSSVTINKLYEYSILVSDTAKIISEKL